MQQCTICERENVTGISLHAAFICTRCEKGIIHTDPSQPIYNYYVRKLKSNQHSLHTFNIYV